MKRGGACKAREGGTRPGFGVPTAERTSGAVAVDVV